MLRFSLTCKYNIQNFTNKDTQTTNLPVYLRILVGWLWTGLHAATFGTIPHVSPPAVRDPSNR